MKFFMILEFSVYFFYRHLCSTRKTSLAKLIQKLTIIITNSYYFICLLQKTRLTAKEKESKFAQNV